MDCDRLTGPRHYFHHGPLRCDGPLPSILAVMVLLPAVVPVSVAV